ncbi:MAG: alpha-(1-_3)-arabinofuranosyltransferase family protein [Candidatus Daviesbacteria bacterium]|nr:alpha-(1->3)-arabinofuranosyltransferase family protein [Candidatus Daviesbacteria bacterium]
MKKIILLIFAFATILVTIWFRDGNIMGTAEDSLLFHDITRFLPESQFAWMEHPGLGRATLALTASRPTYEVLAFLQRMGLPNFLIQAMTIWVILVSAGIGVYLIVKEFFPNLQNRYILISVLFYWFNPISLVNVWNRFLSDYIFSFGLLPLVSYFFIKGLKKERYIWSFILVLILPFYSFAFTYIAFDILLWIFFFILTLLFFLTYKDVKSRIFYIKYFFLTLMLFTLTNNWWIGQLVSFKLFNNIYSSVLNFDIANNLGTLDALSKKMGNLSDIFRLVNASFLTEKSLAWVRIFNSPPFILAEYLVTAVILYTIISQIKKQSVLILGGLFFISIYLAKGINPPFGEMYKFFFTNISYLQVFRNPFEKAGFILSLSASLLIGFGIFNLSQLLTKKLSNLLYLTVLGFIAIIWGFPFYAGLVFTSPEPPADNYQIGYKVKVPIYYQQADEWLNSQGNNFRFIGFPLGDEGITYNWEKGYSGVELSSALFSTPGILHNTAVPYFHDLVPHIQETLLSQNDFLKLANALNARFLFIRHDIDFERRKMENPVTIDKNFIEKEKDNQIKKVATFGKLTFWENLQWEDRTFYPAKKIVRSLNTQQVSELLTIDVNKEEVLINDKDILNLEPETLVDISYEKINPTRYVVHIKNESPFILVFSELFNDAWQASYKNNIYKHFRTNFYANGWLIDKAGEFDVAIKYLPQKLLEAGEKTSIISYLGIVLICTFLISKRIKGKLK